MLDRYFLTPRACLTILWLALFFFLSHLSVQARGLPAREGIVNFGKISEHLYRGAQPDKTGMSNLQRLGVKMIINLRMPNDSWQAEAAEAQAHGILYTNLPLHDMGRPTEEQVQTALSLIEGSPGPVFIHCRYGCDRTGTIIACYRIKHDHWSQKDALEEAIRYGISWFERGMRSYIAAYGKAAASAQLAAK